MIRYDSMYGYPSKLDGSRIFKTQDEVLAFDIETATDRLLGIGGAPDLEGVGETPDSDLAKAIVFLAKVIEDARNEAYFVKLKAKVAADQPQAQEAAE